MSEKLFEYNECWLWKRKDSSNYYITWRPEGARGWSRKSTHTSDLEAAKAQLIEFATERALPREQRAEDVVILDILNYYVKTTLAGKRSQRNCRYVLARFCEFLDETGYAFLSDWTLDVQDAFLDWRRQRIREQGYEARNGTLARDMGMLRAAVREYWRRGYIKTAPYIRGVSQSPPRDDFLSLEECEQLLQGCHEYHTWLFIVLGLHTLQRPAAITELRCSQIDFVRRRIDFLAPEHVQSKKRRPIVPITEVLYPILQEAVARSESGHVIEYNGNPIKKIKRSFRRAAERSGVTRAFPYILRHTGATWAVAAGVPIREVAGMLGHTETKTTEIYAKHRPEFLQNMAGALDRLFPAQSRHSSSLAKPQLQLPATVRASRAPSSQFGDKLKSVAAL